MGLIHISWKTLKYKNFRIFLLFFVFLSSFLSIIQFTSYIMVYDRILNYKFDSDLDLAIRNSDNINLSIKENLLLDESVEQANIYMNIFNIEWNNEFENLTVNFLGIENFSNFWNSRYNEEKISIVENNQNISWKAEDEANFHPIFINLRFALEHNISMGDKIEMNLVDKNIISELYPTNNKYKFIVKGIYSPTYHYDFAKYWKKNQEILKIHYLEKGENLTQYYYIEENYYNFYNSHNLGYFIVPLNILLEIKEKVLVDYNLRNFDSYEQIPYGIENLIVESKIEYNIQILFKEKTIKGLNFEDTKIFIEKKIEDFENSYIIHRDKYKIINSRIIEYEYIDDFIDDYKAKFFIPFVAIISFFIIIYFSLTRNFWKNEEKILSRFIDKGMSKSYYFKINLTQNLILGCIISPLISIISYIIFLIYSYIIVKVNFYYYYINYFNIFLINLNIGVLFFQFIFSIFYIYRIFLIKRKKNYEDKYQNKYFSIKKKENYSKKVYLIYLILFFFALLGLLKAELILNIIILFIPTGINSYIFREQALIFISIFYLVILSFLIFSLVFYFFFELLKKNKEKSKKNEISPILIVYHRFKDNYNNIRLFTIIFIFCLFVSQLKTHAIFEYNERKNSYESSITGFQDYRIQFKNSLENNYFHDKFLSHLDIISKNYTFYEKYTQITDIYGREFQIIILNSTNFLNLIQNNKINNRIYEDTVNNLLKLKNAKNGFLISETFYNNDFKYNESVLFEFEWDNLNLSYQGNFNNFLGIDFGKIEQIIIIDIGSNKNITSINSYTYILGNFINNENFENNLTFIVENFVFESSLFESNYHIEFKEQIELTYSERLEYISLEILVKLDFIMKLGLLFLSLFLLIDLNKEIKKNCKIYEDVYVNKKYVINSYKIEWFFIPIFGFIIFLLINIFLNEIDNLIYNSIIDLFWQSNPNIFNLSKYQNFSGSSSLLRFNFDTYDIVILISILIILNTFFRLIYYNPTKRDKKNGKL